MSSQKELECQQNFFKNVKETRDCYQDFVKNLTALQEMIEDASQNPALMSEYSDRMVKIMSFAQNKTFYKLADLYEDFASSAADVLENWDDCAQFDKNFCLNYVEDLPEIIEPYQQIIRKYSEEMVEMFSEMSGSGHTYAPRGNVLPFNQALRINNSENKAEGKGNHKKMKFKFDK